MTQQICHKNTLFAACWLGLLRWGWSVEVASISKSCQDAMRLVTCF